MTGYGYVPQGGTGNSRQPDYGMPPGPGSGAPAYGLVPQPQPRPVGREQIVLRQWSTLSGLVILVIPLLVGATAIWGGVLGGAYILSGDRDAWVPSVILVVFGGLLVLLCCALLSMRSVLGPEGIELRTAFGSTSVPWPTTRDGITIGSTSSSGVSLMRASVWLNVVDPHGTPVRLTGLIWMGPSVSSLIPRATARADRIWAWAWERGYVQAGSVAQAPGPPETADGTSYGTVPGLSASMPGDEAASRTHAEGGAVSLSEEHQEITAEVEAVQAERSRREAAGAGLPDTPEPPLSVHTPYAQWPGPRPVASSLPLSRDRIVLHRWSVLVSLRKIAVMALFTVPAIAWGVNLYQTTGSVWSAALPIVPASLLLLRTCVRATGRTILDARGITVRSVISSRRWPWPTSRTGLYASGNTAPRPGVAGSRVVLVPPDGEPRSLPGTDTDNAFYARAEHEVVERADRIWAWACARGYTQETGEYTYLRGTWNDFDQSWRNRQEGRYGLTPGNHPPRP